MDTKKLLCSRTSESFSVVSSVLDQYILGAVSDHFYNKYLDTKIEPFTVKKAIMLA